MTIPFRYWYLLIVALLFDNALAVGEELGADSVRSLAGNSNAKPRLRNDSTGTLKLDAEPKARSQALSLDSLDSFGKSEDSNRKSSSFSLDQLDEASRGDEQSDSPRLDDFTPQQWTDNLRFTVDLAVRPNFNGRTGAFGSTEFAGVDLHKVFTNKQGDWGTLTLQAYLTRVDNAFTQQDIFRDDSEFAVDYRILNFNYTGYGKGKTNFRIGSFEIPFGLEQNVNTNGTLRQLTHQEDFGVKTDWGVTLNGESNDMEYELGLSRGSGNNWRRRDDPFILAGRVGTSRSKQTILGVSAFYGEVINYGAEGGTIERGRVGADFTYFAENFSWMGEVSAGGENDDPAYTALLEIDWTDVDESLLFYNQTVLRGLERGVGWDNELRNTLGVRWTPDRHWTLSAQFTHFFDTLRSSSRGTELQCQLRYRF